MADNDEQPSEAMLADSAYVPLEADDLTERHRWFCKECPLKHSCSAASWKKAACWSYHGEEVVREKVKKHLLTSGHHCNDPEMDDDKASMLAGMAEYDVETETAADRAAYRKQVEAARGTTSTGKTFGGGRGKGGGGSSRAAEPKPLAIGGRSQSSVVARGSVYDARAAAQRRPARSRSRSRRRSRDRGRSSGSNAMVPRQRMVNISAQRAQLLIESLTRSAHSIRQVEHLATAASSKATELASAFTVAASQFNEEANVLRTTMLTVMANLQETGAAGVTDHVGLS